MDIETFRRGAIIGLAIAAPVGPIGILVIQRSLRGMLPGLASGLGAATADAIYALGGALATALVARLLAHSAVFELAGAVALAYLAARTWLVDSTRESPLALAVSDLARAFGGTLVLTLANPSTLLSFMAVSASVGLAAAPSASRAALFSSGVFVGSAAWWLLLSSGVRLGSRRFTPRFYRSVRLASGLVLGAFAALALGAAIRTFSEPPHADSRTPR